MRTARFGGPRVVLAATLAMALVAAACGDDDDSVSSSSSSSGGTSSSDGSSSSSSSSGSSSTTGAGGGEELTPLQTVYAAVEGLEGQERFDKLVELAAQESGKIVSYTAETEPMNVVVVERWKEDTGIDIEIFRESSSALLERLVQEKSAGRSSADVVMVNANSMWPAVEEGICADLPEELPAAEGVVEGGLYDEWVVIAITPYVPVWNTDRVSPADVPTSWQDVLSGRFDGTLGVEPTAWNRYASIILTIAEEEGISEEEAIELVRPGFEHARSITGHSALQSLLNTGELDIIVQDQPVAEPDITAGAPVTYMPAVTPLPAAGNGVCIVESTPNPATALLYIDWRLTTGQEVGYETSKLIGSNPAYTPSAAEIMGVGEDDVYLIPRELYEQRDKWLAVYEDLVSETTAG